MSKHEVPAPEETELDPEQPAEAADRKKKRAKTKPEKPAREKKEKPEKPVRERKEKPAREKKEKPEKPERERKEKPVREKKVKPEKPKRERKEKPVREKKEKPEKLERERKEKPEREKKGKPEKPERERKEKPVREKKRRPEAAPKQEKEEALNPEDINMEDLEQEIRRGNYRSTYRKVLRSTFFSLVVVAAVAVLIAVLFLPVLQITGTSMTPTLQDGQIVVGMNSGKYKTGEVIAFYYNNNILVKRVIATAGQWVDIDEDGNVYVDNEKLDEPYVEELALGDCNIDLPYQVPDERIFVMGDHRSTSIDSRNTAVGCISSDVVIGRVLVGVWPLNEIGIVK